jgi:hypothetical protein
MRWILHFSREGCRCKCDPCLIIALRLVEGFENAYLSSLVHIQPQLQLEVGG